MAVTVYRPGAIVPASGIYRVIHDPEHMEEHEVTAIRGRRFPTCNHCGRHPRFILVHAAMHVEDHEAFAG